MTDGHPIPKNVTKIHRHSPVVDAASGRRVGTPVGNRQGSPKRREAEQPAAAPISISGDWRSLAAGVAAAADPGAHLAELVRSTIERAAPAIRDADWARMKPLVLQQLAEARAEGYRAGKREGLAAGSVELKASPELLAALKQEAPTVTVQASPVAINNQVIVPARKIIAVPGRDGTVEMTPVDE